MHIELTPVAVNTDDGKLIAQGFGEAPWTFTWIDEMGQAIRTTEASTVADVFEATTGVEDETEEELAEAAIEVTIAMERMLISNDEAIEVRVTISIFNLSGQRVPQFEFKHTSLAWPRQGPFAKL